MKNALLVFLLLISTAACVQEKKGPVEKAGEKIDQKIEETGKDINRNLDKVEKKIDEKTNNNHN